MFCESCGAALKDGAKFCGSCGAKVESSATAASSSVVNSIRLAALPAGLANCEINIKSVTAEGPDSDGDLSISITYEVTNKSDEDWEYLSVRTQLLNAAGQIVEDTQDTHEQSFDAGETEELQASFYRVKAKFLGENPEKAHLVINAVASTLIQQKLGQVDIPANAFEVTALKPTKLGESVHLISGSLWKTEPDDDKDCRVEVKALIQNLTDKSLPLVKITAEVKDKKGNEVADAGGSEEVRPGSIVTVSGSGYTKDKKLIGAKADLAVLVYTPVAAGVSQCQGVTVTGTANDDDEDSDESESSESERRPNEALTVLLQPSVALAAVIGAEPVTRTEVVTKLWAYIKANGLQDVDNKRNVNADAKLLAVFGAPQVSMFELAAITSKHLN